MWLCYLTLEPKNPCLSLATECTLSSCFICFHVLVAKMGSRSISMPIKAYFKSY